MVNCDVPCRCREEIRQQLLEGLNGHFNIESGDGNDATPMPRPYYCQVWPIRTVIRKKLTCVRYTPQPLWWFGMLIIIMSSGPCDMIALSMISQVAQQHQ